MWIIFSKLQGDKKKTVVWKEHRGRDTQMNIVVTIVYPQQHLLWLCKNRNLTFTVYVRGI